MKSHYIKLTVALLFVLFTGDVNAQRRGVNGGGSSKGGSAGMGMVRPQPSIAPPQTYQPRRGGDAATSQQGGSFGRQPNNYPTGPATYPATPRRGTDVNVTRPGSFGKPGSLQGAGSNRIYRVWEGLPYGRNYISVRPQGLYYFNNGYYASYYAPRIGLTVSVLPYDYYSFYYGPALYYYGGGMYYQQTNDNYTVVEPPMGAEVKQLPDDARSIVINGIQYYEYNGVYYQPITKDDGTQTYQIAGKDGELNTDDPNMQEAPPIQVGDLVDNLPEEYKVVTLNGQKYYVTPSGYYLQDAVDENGKKVYKIISVPAPDGGDDKK